MICYVFIWKDIKVCIIILIRVKSFVLKKEIWNENICYFCKEFVFYYYFVFYVFSFVSVNFLFKNLWNCFLFFLNEIIELLSIMFCICWLVYVILMKLNLDIF